MKITLLKWMIFTATCLGLISCKERPGERVEEYWEERVQHNLNVADLSRSPWKLIDWGDSEMPVTGDLPCMLNFVGPDKALVVSMGEGRFQGIWKISGWRIQIQELATKPWIPLPGEIGSRISNVAEWGIDANVLTLKGRDGKWMKFQRDTQSPSGGSES
ncbi:hypothetical protein FEM03_20765 [Phragmitibacter flavus]|uniref:Uncharacterized protein n=1 Tax=Phragmitibacter flavus TaxID=2576071 RepID=A0A5R8KB48_9BACT|nr:hypothetical protein [Phragmitibacter flavus]TLD68769.1 hypothetical protein FEM03_20765 [Phragmitibacter flavus]